MVRDLVGGQAGLAQERLGDLKKLAGQVLVRHHQRPGLVQGMEAGAALDRELVGREMAARMAERAAQLGLPGGHRLARPGIDQIERPTGKEPGGEVDRGQRLGRIVLAPERSEVAVVQRLHAQRHPPHPRRPKAKKLAGLDRGGVGLERDLEVGCCPPMTKSPLDHRRRGGRLHQGRGAPSEENGRQETGAGQGRHVIELGQKRPPPALMVDAGPDMAVEIAIGTLGPAKGPVDIEPETGLGRLSRDNRHRPHMGKAAGQGRAR